MDSIYRFKKFVAQVGAINESPFVVISIYLESLTNTIQDKIMKQLPTLWGKSTCNIQEFPG